MQMASTTGRFQARYRVDREQVSIGCFDTAVEAAVAYARSVGEYQPPAQPPPTVATEAEGLRLHLSSRSSTGYMGVSKHPSTGRFKAEHRVDGRQVYLGLFDTAVEAAVAYARATGEAAAEPERRLAQADIEEAPERSEVATEAARSGCSSIPRRPRCGP